MQGCPIVGKITFCPQLRLQKVYLTAWLGLRTVKLEPDFAVQSLKITTFTQNTLANLFQRIQKSGCDANCTPLELC